MPVTAHHGADGPTDELFRCVKLTAVGTPKVLQLGFNLGDQCRDCGETLTREGRILRISGWIVDDCGQALSSLRAAVMLKGRGHSEGSSRSGGATFQIGISILKCNLILVELAD